MPSWKSGARREDWQFAGKFGYGIGLGEYKFRLRETFPKLLKSSQEFEVELYLDEDSCLLRGMRSLCASSFSSL